jgi:hypothetical protein
MCAVARAMEVRPSVVFLQPFFFLYMPVEKMDKKNKRKHMNSIKLPQASGCIR